MVAVNRSQFYPWIAIALSAVVILGFSRTYYLRVFYEVPPITRLVHLHALVFTAWLALFITQTRLIAAHRVDLHMKLGIAGVVLAAVVTAVGVWTVVVGAGPVRVRMTGLTNAQHTLVGFTTLVLFAGFIALAVALRRRPSLHKRFMVLAMIAGLSPATARIMMLLGSPQSAKWFVPLAAGVFLIVCMVHDWRRHRVIHPAYVIGGAVIVASWPWRYIAARQEWYQPIGEWIARIGAGA